MHYIQQRFIETMKRKGVTSPAVLAAMRDVPRHLFVSEALRYRAYDDAPLPIGFGQTISTPSVIGLMVQALELTGEERVLEVGTGSGYQTAILARLAGSVVTVERIGELLSRARGTLAVMGCRNVSFIHSSDVREADGIFDAIVVSAGSFAVHPVLMQKLAQGGRLVVPIGGGSGHVITRCVMKADGSVSMDEIGTARFVPFICSDFA